MGKVLAREVRRAEALEAELALELRLAVVVHVVRQGGLVLEHVLTLRTLERFVLELLVVAFVNFEVVNVREGLSAGLYMYTFMNKGWKERESKKEKAVETWNKNAFISQMLFGNLKS